MAKPPSPVGRGRPPKDTQFKKGQSGNPKGRPRGSVNLTTLLKKELQREIIAKEAGSPEPLTAFGAVARAMCHKAIKGDVSAASLILKLGVEVFRGDEDEEQNSPDVEDAAIIDSYWGRMGRPS